MMMEAVARLGQAKYDEGQACHSILQSFDVMRRLSSCEYHSNSKSTSLPFSCEEPNQD